MADDSPSPATEALSHALQHAVERAGPSVVRVGSARGHATSGTVWSDDGLVLTTPLGTRRARRLTVRGADEREREAELLGRDPGTDLALLRVDGEGLPAIARGPSDPLPAVGTLAVALARPGWRIRASLRLVGLVGPGFHRRGHGERGGHIDAWLETDRSLPRGFSGGPLVDGHGRMLGLDSRGLVRHADLAIPLATVERVVAELAAHGSVRRAFLGVSLITVEPPERPDAAVLVAGLDRDGPAAKAGVLLGDILVAIDGATIDGPGALRDSLEGKVDTPLDLTLLRGGRETQLQVTPVAR